MLIGPHTREAHDLRVSVADYGESLLKPVAERVYLCVRVSSFHLFAVFEFHLVPFTILLLFAPPMCHCGAVSVDFISFLVPLLFQFILLFTCNKLQGINAIDFSLIFPRLIPARPPLVLLHLFPQTKGVQIIRSVILSIPAEFLVSAHGCCSNTFGNCYFFAVATNFCPYPRLSSSLPLLALVARFSNS